MNLNRRELMKSVGAGALALGTSRSTAATTGAITAKPDFSAIRADFPRAAENLWLAAAETHPFSVHTLRAIEGYSQYRALGGLGREGFTPSQQAETKQMFAALINATPEEIAFVLSTTDGENLVVSGLGLAERGGNVVIDDLHFAASRYLYTALADAGHIELRVVRHKGWKIDVADMERMIDRDTRLVSMALVSNINGYMHDVRAISHIAHAHGAYVYADIIQAAGNTAVDVQAMGIDCCACSTYKWLMGDFGLGFLYVRRDLQGDVIKQTRYGLRQVTQQNGRFVPRPGAAMYEGTTTMPYLPAVCARQGLKYLTALGVNNIRAHAKRLVDRLQREMTALGYSSITPLDTPTPIVSFLTPEPELIQARLDRAFGQRVVSPGRWQMTAVDGAMKTVRGIRIGVSVYNNDEDIDRFLTALD
ncbi:MAG: aminotransferase class V-fold PLP-dependent enzyme [Acidobacteriota bacterium]|nr:aminotransferase class V-fold PLP-dependent enzyme [Acidobacteriota bacterium]